MPERNMTLYASRAWVGGVFQPARVDVVDGVITSVATGDAALRSGSAPGFTGNGHNVTESGVVAAASATSSSPAPLIVHVHDSAVLLPGLVDSHVHVNEPGRTEWEGFRSATLAAAAGGITTLIDMPLNAIPPTTTREALEIKREAAARSAYIDLGFWGGAVPENLGSLEPLHDGGVFGFKCFLSPSGVDEFGHLDREQLLAAMREIAALGSRIIIHAEDPALFGDGGALGQGYERFLESRPPASEQSAIDTIIDAVRLTGCRTHILHLSDGRALPAIREAKAEGLPITVETCPHYLTIIAEEIPDGAVEFKCCPPIREAANRDLLWEGICDGTIDAIVSDHSPSTVELKRLGDGDFGLGWGGISGLQLGLSAVWTEANQRGIPLSTVLPLYTTGPALVAGLDKVPGLDSVGKITEGALAHLTIFAPNEQLTVDARRLLHRNPISAYDGRTFAGHVRHTWLAGRTVFDASSGGAGEAPQQRQPPAGQLLSALPSGARPAPLPATESAQRPETGAVSLSETGPVPLSAADKEKGRIA